MIELQKSEILKIVVKAYKDLPLDIRQAITGLTEEGANELSQFFEGLLKMQSPIQQASDMILRCCADIALVLCDNEQS